MAPSSDDLWLVFAAGGGPLVVFIMKVSKLHFGGTAIGRPLSLPYMLAYPANCVKLFKLSKHFDEQTGMILRNEAYS